MQERRIVMKARNGFISNSSSTSFIVARGTEEDLKFRIEISLRPERVIYDREELQEWMSDQYGSDWESQSWGQEIYAKCKQQLDLGQTVQIFSIYNDGGNSGMTWLYDNQSLIEGAMGDGVMINPP
jgi:hypothetical protein